MEDEKILKLLYSANNADKQIGLEYLWAKYKDVTGINIALELTNLRFWILNEHTLVLVFRTHGGSEKMTMLKKPS